MKKNGFTVVELIASFALTMIISLFLFEVLIDVKDIFVETSIKTNIQEKLAIISKNIKYQINNGSSISCASNACTINNDLNLITFNENSIKVGGQKYEMPKYGDNQVEIKDENIANNCDENSNNCYLKISFRLTHKNLSKSYDYNVVYYYTTN